MATRPETGVSKAHGETSVLLNFTDFPSPLYRFIYYRPVARIISISVKQRGIAGCIYDSPYLYSWFYPSFFFILLSVFFKRWSLKHEPMTVPRTHEPEYGPPLGYYLSRIHSCSIRK